MSGFKGADLPKRLLAETGCVSIYYHALNYNPIRLHQKLRSNSVKLVLLCRLCRQVVALTRAIGWETRGLPWSARHCWATFISLAVICLSCPWDRKRGRRLNEPPCTATAIEPRWASHPGRAVKHHILHLYNAACKAEHPYVITC